MESEQSISTETTEFNTSIGPVNIEVGGRDWFAVQTVIAGRPKIDLTIGRENGVWEKPDEVTIITAQPRKEVAASPELIDELFTLTTGWADAHPEEFERAAAEEFDDLISYIVHDSFDQVLGPLKRIKRDVTKVLRGDDCYSGGFACQAPPQLRQLVENAVKMLHVMGLQIDAAGEAISEAATAHTGRQIRRPGNGGRPFFDDAADEEND